MLIFITIVAVLAASLCAAQAWRLTRDAQQRSAARVAALSAAIDPPRSGLMPSLFADGAPGATALHPLLKAGFGFATVVALIVVVAAASDLLGRSPAGPESSSAVLALLSMHHERELQSLTVKGLVRNQGRASAQRVTAIVLVFDREGQAVGSAHAPLQRQTLSPGDESAFSVAIPRTIRNSRLEVRIPMGTSIRALAAAALSAAVAASLTVHGQEGFRFKSGVDLVNVTATVSDDSGRFVSGLTKDDFVVYDNGMPQPITHFNSERVPVSLGIVLDTSGSMTDDKMTAARRAIDRFIVELLGPDDELFFVEFSDSVRLRQDWTHDRAAINRAVRRVSAGGGTALYEAIADSLPVAAAGKHRKKALLVISDGNDTQSRVTVSELREAIRESEVLVYALGIDGSALPPDLFPTQPPRRPPTTTPPVRPPNTPFPIPGVGTIGRPRTFPQIVIGGGGGGRGGGGGSGGPMRGRPRIADARVNAGALRDITDDTGGRTEIIHELRDLEAATARIADELSKQYSLAYVAPGERDGRWHTIKVEVKGSTLTVRARRGYLAS
jgi:VWFA-related protein